MFEFPVIIIGAGPGGLTCAHILAKHGIKVLVLERRKKIGPKPCGGGITWKGLLQKVPGQIIERAFPIQHIYSNFQKIQISSPNPIIATVDRENLGQWMAAQAIEAGAKILTDTRVVKIYPYSLKTIDGNGVEKRYTYQYLIGADGSTSGVRKYLRLPTRYVGIGVHYQVPGDFDAMEWHLNTRLFKNGYSWIFPFADHASIGVYTDGRFSSAKEIQNRLHIWAGKNNISLKGAKPEAGFVNYDYQGWRFGNKMLVGDAAGLASGLTGEGMFPAIISGETAAHTIINPDYRSDNLNRLIAKQQNHRQILQISGKSSLICTLTMELLVLSLRTGIIPFHKLELGE